MADIRCPMCGKPNPENQVECQFCQARIVPLISGDFSAETPATHATDDQPKAGLPDWSNSDWDDDTDSSDEVYQDQDPLGWLNRIRGESDVEGEEPPEFGVESPLDDESPSLGGDSDWLQRIRSLHQSEQDDETDPSDSPAFDDSPQSFESDLILDQQNPAANENDIPDWLESLQNEGTVDAPDVDAPDSEESPDWLLQNEADPPSVLPITTKAEEIPDWLSSLDGFENAETNILTPSSPGETVDWVADDENEEQGKDTLEDADIPDWLSGLNPNEDAEQEPSSVVEADTPDWLSNLKGNTAPLSIGGEQDDAEIPDWLSADMAAPPEQKPVSSDAEEFPDWLANLGGDDVSSDDPDLAIAASTPGEISDWFSNIEDDGNAFQTAFTADDELHSEIPEDEATPNWLQNLGTVSAGNVDDHFSFSSPDAITPFVGEDSFDDDLLDVDGLPDWLSDEPASAEEVAKADAGADIEPAELPGWLEAMRPVDSGGADALRDDHVESAGPLAGLRGVLSAEPESVKAGAPPQYTAKLNISDTQSTHAGILKTLVEMEAESSPIRPESILSTQRVLRWIIALIMCLVVGFVVIAESQNVPFPTTSNIPSQTTAASKIVTDIANEAPVLIAFDYDPGMSGEMHASAASLVDHLMLKAARLTFVSTLPTGPALAEYFINNVQTQHHYSPGEQYVNLGYVPGGATGLQSFARTPQLTFPPSNEDSNPWKMPPLQNITALSDFDLIVLITDDPDTARAWIEQVQPNIGNTPLISVVSAQAEPMVRPYFGSDENAQVSGIISGLNGGVAYEVAVGQPNLGRKYWDAFSVGLIVAVGAILIGGAMAVSSRILSKRKVQQEETE